MNDKIIDITHLIKPKGDKWIDAALDLLHQMDNRVAGTLVQGLVNYILLEVKSGLGLLPLDASKQDKLDLKFYPQIDELYREAAQGCYFCDKEIDANAVEVNKVTYICANCQLKAANLLTACGIDEEKLMDLFPFVLGPRKIQKTRLFEQDQAWRCTKCGAYHFYDAWDKCQYCGSSR